MEGKMAGIDIKKIISNKFVNVLFIMILLIIPMALNYNLRITTVDIPQADEWARKGIINSLKAQITADTKSRYYDYDISKQYMQEIIDETFANFLKQADDQIKNQIVVNTELIKDKLRDPYGHTYLLEIDPYFWARLANNVADHGYPGDYIKDFRMPAPSYRRALLDEQLEKDTEHLSGSMWCRNMYIFIRP